MASMQPAANNGNQNRSIINGRRQRQTQPMPAMARREFGTFLRRLRLKRKLSLRQVAAMSGFSHETINCWERGRIDALNAVPLKRLAWCYNSPADIVENKLKNIRKSPPAAEVNTDPELPFGEAVKQIRKSKMLSLREVEEASGISNAYLSQIEQSKRGIPTIEFLYKLSTGLGIGFADMLAVAASAVTGQKSKINVSNIMTDSEISLLDNFRKLSHPAKIFTLSLVDFYQGYEHQKRAIQKRRQPKSHKSAV